MPIFRHHLDARKGLLRLFVGVSHQQVSALHRSAIEGNVQGDSPHAGDEIHHGTSKIVTVGCDGHRRFEESVCYSENRQPFQQDSAI